MATVDKSANDKSESDAGVKPISAQEKETGKMEQKDVSSKKQLDTATAAVKNESIETAKKGVQPTQPMVYKVWTSYPTTTTLMANRPLSITTLFICLFDWCFTLYLKHLTYTWPEL